MRRGAEAGESVRGPGKPFNGSREITYVSPRRQTVWQRRCTVEKTRDDPEDATSEIETLRGGSLEAQD